MKTAVEIIESEVSLPIAISQAKEFILSGEIDPLKVWANMSRFKKMIEALQEDAEIKDYALRELSKYGKEHQVSDCKLEQFEAGVKYDYTVCGDGTLDELYKCVTRSIWTSKIVKVCYAVFPRMRRWRMPIRVKFCGIP